MGFSGGGSNVLLPHTHDGRVSQDGGPLNFSNITQSQSAAGEVFYSDGTALQQLVYPAIPAGETLTAAAASTAPSWVTPAAVSSPWTTLYDNTLVGTGTVSTGTFAAHDVLAVYIFGQLNITGNQAVTFNNSGAASAEYTETHSLNFGAAVAQNSLNSIMYQSPSGTPGTGWSMCTMNIINHASQEKNVYFTTTEKQATGDSAPRMWQGGGCWINTANQITRIDLANDSGNQTDYNAGTQLVVLGSS